ncbi:MAG TPA: c-type cytochrome [Chloroflexota bacterium]|nr:c-type cytochrome [Chloroflexota bacterium]
MDLVLSISGLLVGAVLGGWFATRAWRVRGAVLRWLGAGALALGTVVLALVAILALIGVYRFERPPSIPAATQPIAASPERLARGQHLANLCSGCHATTQQLPLGGGNEDFLGPLATLYAPNLTPAGPLAGWSDGDIVRAVRDGVAPDGRSLLIMPAETFHLMSDDDVQSLVTYLRSQPPVARTAVPTQLHLLGAVLGAFGALPMTAQTPTTAPVVAPPAAVTATYGEYLLNISGCRTCHGQNLTGGTNTFVPRGPSLVALVATWSTDQFVNTIRTGTDPSGVQLPPDMMPWPQFSATWSDDELRAIDAYLRTVH